MRILFRKEISRCTGNEAYQRGYRIFDQGKVGSITQTDQKEGIKISCQMQWSNGNRCNPELLLTEEDDQLGIRNYDCDCDLAECWYGMCRHCVALALSYSEYTKREALQQKDTGITRRIRASSSEIQDIFQRFSSEQNNLEARILPGQLHIRLLFNYSEGYSWSHTPRMTLELQAGMEKMYVVKSVPSFIHSILHGTCYTYGKKLSVYHSLEMFDAESREMLEVIITAVRDKSTTIDSDTSCYSSSQDRSIALDSRQASRLMLMQAEKQGCVKLSGKDYPLIKGDPDLKLEMTQEADQSGAWIRSPKLECICQEPNGIVRYNGKLFCCTPEFERNVLPVLHAMHATRGTYHDKEASIFLSKNDYTRFCALVLPRLQACGKIELGEVDLQEYMPRNAAFQFFLSQPDHDTVELLPKVCYGDASYPLLYAGTEYRNQQQEQGTIELCRKYFPHSSARDTVSALGDDEAYLLLTEGIDALRGQGELFLDESLRPLKWSGNGSTTLGISLSGGLIDIHVETQELNPAEINRILGAYRQKKKYYRLANGSFLSLAEGGLSVVAELSDELGITLDEGGNARVNAYRAQSIQSLLQKETGDLTVRRNSDFKKQIRALRDYRDSDYELPRGIHAALRGYQQNGYQWLCTLSELGLGGILADDMGLGKTLQMLSYFRQLDGKLLVVCPASLIYNWQKECNRFTPDLETHIIRGTARQRKDELSAPRGVFITSYEQLRRDQELYSSIRFDCCVLDEAQYIRNAATKAAKAVKTIQAEHRFALTGTPIENRLSDLWSIFDFLMPGYLFSYADFKARIEQRAVDGDEEAMARLTRMTAPFILRRKKQDVLRELPDKVEHVLYVEMTPEQRTLYDAQEQALRLSIQNAPEAEFLQQQIQYLSALTRLRQLCCTPELYLENYDGGAAKVDACIELLRESSESGHKTLVFSQFTGMLEHLIARVQAEGIPSLYLSGKDSSEKRRDMVEQFQTGQIPVFFISLKAGGTGLNLTAADRVIHFDPWWNAAAEDQAAGRTHRIGQKNTVFVTKLVCRDSIEERILDLQARKRSLSDAVVNQEGLHSAALNREELLSLLESHGGDGRDGWCENKDAGSLRGHGTACNPTSV